MKIKGTSILVVPQHIKSKFGGANYNKWLNGISQKAREVYSKDIKAIDWYDLKEIYLDPVKVMCDMFYNGDFKGAWDVVALDAKNALGGFYRIFIKLGSPEFLVKRASVVFPTYYQGAMMEVVESKKGRNIVRITEFGGEKMEEINEYTIKGWMVEALGISGAKDVKVEVTNSLAKGDNYTDFVISWK